MWLRIGILLIALILFLSLLHRVFSQQEYQYDIPIPKISTAYYLAIYADGSALFIIASSKATETAQLQAKILKKIKEFDSKIKFYTGNPIVDVETKKANRAILHGFASFWADSIDWFKETLSEIPTDFSALASLALGIFVRINWASVRIMMAQESLDRSTSYAILKPSSTKMQGDFVRITDNIKTVRISSKYPAVIIRLEKQ